MNEQLAYTVLGFIEAHPERHDQGTWGQVPGELPDGPLPAVEAFTCGTVGCLAYWTVVHRWPDAIVHVVGGEASTVQRPSEPEFFEPISDAAQLALGLTLEQAGTLFYSDWEVRDLRVMIDALAADPYLSGHKLREMAEARPHSPRVPLERP